jgi:hypothetical protein
MDPQSLAEKLKKKSNWLFLRRIYRLGKGATVPQRLRVLNTGNKRQRQFLIAMIHHAVTGEIPMNRDHSLVITGSGKAKTLQKYFGDAKVVSALLDSSDKHQKEVLLKVNNFHILLHYVFHQHHDADD